MMLLSAIINLFMFHKASLYADRKKKLLKKKLGVDFVAKFGFGSGLSYVWLIYNINLLENQEFMNLSNYLF